MKYIIVLAIVSVLVFAACSGKPDELVVGGDRDEHGCIGSAGYSWCPSTQKCQRMWEEFCPEFSEQFRITDFESCAAAGNPVMESYPRQCSARGVNYVEALPGEPGRTYCLPEQRDAEICTMEYFPVCGHDSEGMAVQTYSNPCMACIPAEVEFWTEGEC